jgi:calpain
MKITLAIAEKNWKKLNPNTVSGMIGLYMLEKREGKLTYSEDVVVKQTSFLPVKEISMDVSIGENRPYNRNGYLIMPSTYESKIQGTFIVAIKCDRPFEITSSK